MTAWSPSGASVVRLPEMRCQPLNGWKVLNIDVGVRRSHCSHVRPAQHHRHRVVVENIEKLTEQTFASIR